MESPVQILLKFVEALKSLSNLMRPISNKFILHVRFWNGRIYQTNEQTDKQKCLCIELRYAQLMIRSQPLPEQARLENAGESSLKLLYSDPDQLWEAEVGLLGVNVVHQLCDNLRVGVWLEAVAEVGQQLLNISVVCDDSVVDHSEPVVVAGAVRVAVQIWTHLSDRKMQ